MKTKNKLLFIVSAIICLSNNLTAQSVPKLFKDLNPGTAHADPILFTNVNGTMYFITYSRNPTYIYQLWKSDGTVANTVMLKDNIFAGAIGNAVMFRGNTDNTIFYSVNKSGATAGDTTRLWKSDGSDPVLVATLPHPGYPGVGGGYPTGFTIVGNKLFFSMWKDHGRELWVSDGTAVGTFEVIDLLPGANGGVLDKPMVAFNGKVYFQGCTTLGLYQLFSSDGTAAGTSLIKAGVYNPDNFIVYKNELYFAAGNSNDELWKTDGTASGTIKIATCAFRNPIIFNNQMFFTPSNNLWKSDGTTAGTVLVKNAVGQISGANNDGVYTSYMKSILTAPYYEMQYYKSNGVVDGTVQVSDSLGIHTSFTVLNNKMYTGLKTAGSSIVKGLWETDGTESGTKKYIPDSSPGQPFIFNNTIFFSNTEPSTGIELWSYNAGPSSVKTTNPNQLPSAYALHQNYPNPFNPTTNIEFHIPTDGIVSLKAYDAIGREVATLANEQMNAGSYKTSFDGKGLASGVYFYRLKVNNYVDIKRMTFIK